jgi:general secretion pathway protein D
VPLLGDLPLLGYFFKHQTRRTQKMSLLIFLTPHIVKDAATLRAICERKWRERQEFLERYTAFRDPDVLRHAQYRFGRGLLEEINRVARAADEEQRQREQAERLLRRRPDDDGPVAVELTTSEPSPHMNWPTE